MEPSEAHHVLVGQTGLSGPNETKRDKVGAKRGLAGLSGAKLGLAELMGVKRG